VIFQIFLPNIIVYINLCSLYISLLYLVEDRFILVKLLSKYFFRKPLNGSKIFVR